VGWRCPGLDRVILKEDHNRRGRAPGEIARVIGDGLAEVGIAADQVETVYSEPEAVAQAIDQLGDGDLVVVLAENVTAVLEQLRPLRA
jgi:cyanophycin synthetase